MQYWFDPDPPVTVFVACCYLPEVAAALVCCVLLACLLLECVHLKARHGAVVAPGQGHAAKQFHLAVHPELTCLAEQCPDDSLLAVVQPDWVEDQWHEAVVFDLKQLGVGCAKAEAMQQSLPAFEMHSGLRMQSQIDNL